ncbi:Outer membrane receptor proteins, mostly Fe transport [Sphingomonas sp. YR710]|uniref:TonB-dependent receptor n=1 Tax=Sphingomonas sp. YR710 TaxID=1882773 RepID=UPI0008851DC4|nr:TonB-dependent receptor [Sphingomonas sp. YR710]SDC65283.1 Outer membrane receptor proteins, mostly Fe transport [Sphingomonas sp. YR710]
MRATKWTTSRKRAGTLALLLAGTVLPAPIMAQTPDANATADQGDEIIVTAQKREENLQSVPISIQALGTAKLEQYNINNFNDYTKLLPSVSFQTSSPGTTNVYFRGVASGGDGNHSGSLPSVGVYLDEQPITTIGGTLDVHIYDIQRIEALSGPQGTLYGASSEAGTLRIITNKPTTKGFDAGFDSEVNHIRSGDVGGKVEGFVNQPINDTMAIRLVGFYEHDAGYIDNVPANFDIGFGKNTFGSGVTINNNAVLKKNYNDTEVFGGRAALKIDIDDNWTVLPTFLAQDQKTHGSYGYYEDAGDLKTQHFGPEQGHDRFWQAALTVEGKVSNFDITYAGAYMDRHITSVSDYTDYAVTYDAAYSGGFSTYFTNAAGAYIDPSQHIVGHDHFTKLSQELRASSPQENRFRVIGGLFYQKQTHLIIQDYQIYGLTAATSVNGRPGTIWLTDQDRIDRDYAVFGEAAFDITPKLTLTGGLRAFKYDNSLFGFFGFGTGFSGSTGVGACNKSFRDSSGNYIGPILPGAPCTNLGDVVNGKVVPKKAKGDGITHKLNLTWKPTDDYMVYATWSRGFRPGGINRRGGLPPYDPDYLTNYELGFKTTLFDKMLRFNGAIYLQNWKSFQFAFLGLNSLTQIQNGSDARIKGVELDFTLKPEPGFTISGSAAYTDAKLRKNICNAADSTFQCTAAGNFITAPKGTQLPVTPKFKANMTARYDFDVAGHDSHFQAVAVHASSAPSQLRTADQAIVGTIPGYWTFDVAAGAKFGRISTEIYIQNLLDERAQISRSVACSICTRPSTFVQNPQTIGLRVGWKY